MGLLSSWNAYHFFVLLLFIAAISSSISPTTFQPVKLKQQVLHDLSGGEGSITPSPILETSKGMHLLMA
jgi:hypothetical protein